MTHFCCLRLFVHLKNESSPFEIYFPERMGVLNLYRFFIRDSLDQFWFKCFVFAYWNWIAPLSSEKELPARILPLSQNVHVRSIYRKCVRIFWNNYNIYTSFQLWSLSQNFNAFQNHFNSIKLCVEFVIF